MTILYLGSYSFLKALSAIGMLISSFAFTTSSSQLRGFSVTINTAWSGGKYPERNSWMCLRRTSGTVVRTATPTSAPVTCQRKTWSFMTSWLYEVVSSTWNLSLLLVHLFGQRCMATAGIRKICDHHLIIEGVMGYFLFFILHSCHVGFHVHLLFVFQQGITFHSMILKCC